MERAKHISWPTCQEKKPRETVTIRILFPSLKKNPDCHRFPKSIASSAACSMAQRLFRVADVFAFESGLIIVATDCAWNNLPAVLQIGSAIEFRCADGSVFRSTIAGIAIG